MDSSHRSRAQSSAQPLPGPHYRPCRQRQTASTAHLDRSRPVAVQVWVAVSVAVRSVACRGNLVVGVRGRSLLVGDSLRRGGRAASRTVSRSGCRCMRLEEGAARSSAAARRSALLVGTSVGLWEEWARACYSQVVRWRFVEAVSPGRASAQPEGCQWCTNRSEQG